MTTKKAGAILAIFKPGTHIAMDGRELSFSEADCRQIAETYDPELHEAPFVIGHPSATAPSYGWAGKMEYRDGLLYTTPKQVCAEFAEAFNAGRYKKRSISVFLPTTPGNPTPGKYYLRHVGFLGAVPPAVKGLPDVQFAEYTGEDAPAEFATPWAIENLIDMFRGLRDYLIEKEGAEAADRIIPQWRITDIEGLASTPEKNDIPLAYSEENDVDKNTPSSKEAEFAEREATLAAREEKLRQQEEEAAKAALAARRTAVIDFAEKLAKDGKILPRQKQPVAELLMSLSAEPISFADGSTTISKAPEDLLREILETKPAAIDFSEKSDPNKTGAPAEFADAESLASAARTYQSEQEKLGNTISTSEAVRHVKRGKAS